MSRKFIFCVATGPSLTWDDALLVAHAKRRGNWCIAVNDAYRWLDYADAHVAYDSAWWFHHWGKGIEKFKGVCYTPDPDVAARFGIRELSWLGPAPPGLDSGYYGIATAIKFCAKNIVLLGYDMKHAKDGKTHFFGDHESPLRNSSPYKLFLEKYKVLADWCSRNGVTVINCTRDSDLNYFQKMDLEAVIDEINSA